MAQHPAQLDSWHPPRLSRWHVWFPALILALGTAAVWAFDLDRAAARHYFDPAGPPAWPVGYGEPWSFLYTWGVMPAMAVAVAGIALLAAGWTRALPWPRWAGLLILISLTLGPLMLTNGVFHELWGRPRPRQVVEFGGDRQFRPVLLPTFRHDEPGFPTGHAAGGFAVLIAYFALRPRSRSGAWAVLAAGVALGSITAWARIAQGGHFLSDGLWAAGVIWFSTLAVHWGLGRYLSRRPPATRATPRGKALLIWALATVAAVGLIVGYAAYLPIQERAEWRVPLTPDVRSAHILIGAPGLVRTREAAGTNEVRIFATLSGRGWPWAELWERRAGPVTVGGDLRLHYTALGRGMRRSGNVSVVVLAPPGFPVTVEALAAPLPPRSGPRTPAN